MSLLRIFKGYRELEERHEALNREFNKIFAELTVSQEELAMTRKELDEARAELEKVSSVSSDASPKQRPLRVPHCTTCPYHVRFNHSGKYAHRCQSVGCMISGNDTRTSPKWCPLRGKESGNA